MAEEKFWVAFDVQHDGAGYDGIKPETKFKKGKTLGSEEPVTGLRGQVFAAKLVQVEAEGEEEACKIAGEAYGSRGGVSAVPNGAKTLKFFSV